MPPETTLSKNSAGGDIAGRDVVKNITYQNANDTFYSHIKVLSAQFRVEQQRDERTETIIQKLQHYFQNTDEKIIGLDEKLNTAGHPNLRFAKECKERFTKKLTAFQFSETAQRIHAHLLAGVYGRFENLITPLIAQGCPMTVILAKVQESVVDHVESRLGDNVTDLDAIDLNGMLYFLTGNCHIKWSI